MITPELGTTGRLDVLFRTINECADSDGQHNAARNQVPSPSDTGYDRFPGLSDGDESKNGRIQDRSLEGSVRWYRPGKGIHVEDGVENSGLFLAVDHSGTGERDRYDVLHCLLRLTEKVKALGKSDCSLICVQGTTGTTIRPGGLVLIVVGEETPFSEIEIG